MTQIIGKLYEKLWRKVGGKPWTEIVREDQKASPLLYLLIFLADTGRIFTGYTVQTLLVVRPWKTG